MTKKGKGYYILFATIPLGIVSSLLYFILDHSDRTFSILALLLVVLGSVTALGGLFKRYEWLPMVSTWFYIAGFAVALNKALPSLSDVWNGVNFIGGNAVLGSVFTLLYFLTAFMGILACFSDYNQESAV